MEIKGKKSLMAAVGTFLGLFSLSQVYQNTPHLGGRVGGRAWLASSSSWLDQKACDWVGLCGLAHLQGINHGDEGKINLADFWNDARNIPDGWETQVEREIPRYVLDHAPLIHLFSGEQYWPCDMAEHLIHTTPHLNYTPLQATDDHPTISNLGKLNRWGRFVYLQSDDNVEDYPDWLGGETNIPTAPTNGYGEGECHGKASEVEKDREGEKPSKELRGTDENWQPELRHKKRTWAGRAGKKVVGGRSEAPVVLIVVPKENGVVDAFWMFFYSYNLGNAVFNVRFGNHVGDWEHTAVRFQHGKPKAIFFSEHSFGEAYTWDAVEKSGKRVSRCPSDEIILPD